MAKGHLAFGTNSSIPVESCQICGDKKLEPILFLGYLPPVNTMPEIGTKPVEEPSYPTQWLFCTRCSLVQLGTIVDPKILFPPEYPYTSSTTKVLRDNFAELYVESSRILNLKKQDLVVDIGSNDGNLLSNFKEDHRVLGITPEEIGRLAIERGIDTIIDYFSTPVVERAIKKCGRAKLITATNVFAHMEDLPEIMKNIKRLLTPDGVFVSESHYLYSLIKTLQWDTIYHEHMRYYSLHSLKYLLEMYGLEVFHAKNIPSHGGSIRVYAARKGQRQILPTVKKMLNDEKGVVDSKKALLNFRGKVILSKLQILDLIYRLKSKKKTIYGIGAPSRGSTLVSYCGIDDGMVDCICEVSGSHKTGKYMPGTMIPVVEEAKLFKDQPDFALFFSWHIAHELAVKLKQKGFKGKFIVPLPRPRILKI